METDFRLLDTVLRTQPRLRQHLHRLRLLTNATQILREQSRPLTALQSDVAAAEAVLLRTAGLSSRRKAQRRHDQAVLQLVAQAQKLDKNWQRNLALERMSSFYDSQMVHATCELKVLGNTTIIRKHGMVLRSNAATGRSMTTPAVTRVQWDYDQSQKKLATQYPKPLTAMIPPDADALAEWQQAQYNYREGRDLYDLMHTWEWQTMELRKHLTSGKVDTEERFNEYIIKEVYRISYSVLAHDEKQFEKAQDKAMRDGLQPVQFLDQDLMIFAEHQDDGKVDSEAPKMRQRIAVAMPDTAMRPRMRRIILWSLKIPYRDFTVSQRAAIPDLMDWDSKSVGLGSSRSQQWNMGQPPSVRRRQRMDDYYDKQKAWRLEANKHYEAHMGRRD
ncbi:hypothetical protein LTR36_008941 [Oleoguttula mirabilis]|uniref:Uncharacterized protein n=1 Tax=Oleoguttula mirabilis TaxID=1507867 RepID=A0AAV9J6V9_9PEZI|nr:hypothetical protein LTR36_008941 [Oleoguttula mirabilis]